MCGGSEMDCACWWSGCDRRRRKIPRGERSLSPFAGVALQAWRLELDCGGDDTSADPACPRLVKDPPLHFLSPTSSCTDKFRVYQQLHLPSHEVSRPLSSTSPHGVCAPSLTHSPAHPSFFLPHEPRTLCQSICPSRHGAALARHARGL